MKTMLLVMAGATMCLGNENPGQNEALVKWTEKNAQAWREVKKEFPQFFKSEATKNQARAIVRKWDKWAEKNDPKMHADPYKPLYFMRMEAREERRAAAERAEAEKAAAAARAAGPPEWKKYVDDANFQRNNNPQRSVDAAIEEYDRRRRAERWIPTGDPQSPYK